MKTLRTIALAAATILLAPAALAGEGGHDIKPQHGGVVTEVKHVVYELVAAGDSLTLYAYDHGKRIDVTGASGKLTLLSGTEKTEASLVPDGDKLTAKGDFKTAPGTRVVAVVNLPGKAPATARFTLK